MILGFSQQLKQHVDDRQAKLVVAKSEYRAALRSLESISEEIHAHRRSHAMGTRERGVGAEVDEGHDDIANFKMESDGLSSKCLKMSFFRPSLSIHVCVFCWCTCMFNGVCVCVHVYFSGVSFS